MHSSATAGPCLTKICGSQAATSSSSCIIAFRYASFSSVVACNAPRVQQYARTSNKMDMGGATETVTYASTLGLRTPIEHTARRNSVISAYLLRLAEYL
jgi:hypothetical protein